MEKLVQLTYLFSWLVSSDAVPVPVGDSPHEVHAFDIELFINGIPWGYDDWVAMLWDDCALDELALIRAALRCVRL